MTPALSRDIYYLPAGGGALSSPRPVLITYQVLNARFSQPTGFYWVDIRLALFVSFYVLAGSDLLRTLS